MTSGTRKSGSGLEFLGVLEEIIDSRIESRPADSYVARLVSQGDRRVAQKLGEEAIEVALAAAAGDVEELREEAADLLFHFLVLLRTNGIPLADIVTTLRGRTSVTD